jgi:hypothetical protein
MHGIDRIPELFNRKAEGIAQFDRFPNQQTRVFPVDAGSNRSHLRMVHLKDARLGNADASRLRRLSIFMAASGGIYGNE